MKKRICALFIMVFTLALSFVALVPEAATRPMNTELLLNGGFETIIQDRGTPQNWDRFGTFGGGGTASVVNAEDEPENVYSGNYSAKIVLPETSTERVSVVQHYRGGVGIGKYKYTMSLMYKGATGNGGFKLGAIQYSGDIQIASAFTGVMQASTEWKKASIDFYAEDNIDRISIVPQGVTKGVEVYFDDVSLMITDGPKYPFTVETDQAFYNEDYTKASVNLDLHELYSSSDYTYDYTVKRGVMTYAKGNNIALDGNETKLEFDITGMAKKAYYTLTLTFRDKDGVLVQTEKRDICRIDRPKNLTKDGVYMVDGKPFEPIYVYHFDFDDAEDAKKAGVNVVQWAPADGTNQDKTIAELDKLHSLGLKAAVVCYWGMQPAGHPNNSSRIQQFVGWIKDHPAVFCYMVMDEPFGQPSYTADEMDGYLRNSYKVIRSVDDTHPVMLCENLYNKMALSAKYVDILGIDPYPGNGSWETTVTDHTTQAVKATEGKKPVYALLQAFTFNGVKPTPDMLRLELYQAMMARAKVVGYYAWLPDNPALDAVLNESEYWDTMVEFNEKDKPLLYSYFGRGEYERYNQYHGDNVWYESWIAGGSLYVSVINRGTGESTEATISLQGENFNAVNGEYNVTVASGGEPLSITKAADNFTISMPRYHSAVYKIDGVGSITDGDEEVNLLVLSDGEEITEAAEAGNTISARAYNIKAGDRLYLALYSGEEGNEGLHKIAVATGTGVSAAACTINDIPGNITAIKAFLWDKNLNVITIKEL